MISNGKIALYVCVCDKKTFCCTTISYQLESTPFDVFSLNFEGALLITFYNNVSSISTQCTIYWFWKVWHKKIRIFVISSFYDNSIMERQFYCLYWDAYYVSINIFLLVLCKKYQFIFSLFNFQVRFINVV